MMLFWTLAIAMTLIVAVGLCLPMLRRFDGEDAPQGSEDMAIYKAQLAEVDRDLARGTLAPEEAERLRTEVARRLLAADAAERKSAGTAPRMANVITISACVALLLGAAIWTYRTVGGNLAPDQPIALRYAEAAATRAALPNQASLEAELPQWTPPADLDPSYLQMINQLREIVPSRPEDAQGWELLALHEYNLGNFSAAAAAQAHLVALKGDAAEAADHIALIDRLFSASQGRASAEIRDAIDRAYALAPENDGSLYYKGLLEAMIGRADQTMPLWRRLEAQTTESSRFGALVRMQAQDIARLAGEKYTPAAPSTPTASQIAQMSPDEQRAAIEQMVQGLAQRLANDGGSANDWAQLVRSLVALGREDEAFAIVSEARTAFAMDPEGFAIILEAYGQ